MSINMSLDDEIIFIINTILENYIRRLMYKFLLFYTLKIENHGFLMIN